ncbi:MAG: hypothetical protein KatS3mg040_0156 [Candidatus Kapaibacterium sp.]|nr:MAG: hypothetical protein KatS3mg040_0156 [Candidatus Kapabacteria bacterium]
MELKTPCGFDSHLLHTYRTTTIGTVTRPTPVVATTWYTPGASVEQSSSALVPVGADWYIALPPFEAEQAYLRYLLGKLDADYIACRLWGGTPFDRARLLDRAEQKEQSCITAVGWKPHYRLFCRWLRRKALIRKKRNRKRIACLRYRCTSDEQKNTPTHCHML